MTSLLRDERLTSDESSLGDPCTPESIAKTVDPDRQIVRQSRLDAQLTPCKGMDKAKRLRVQCLSRKWQRESRPIGRSIHRVADDRMPGVGKVDSDLMSPSGFQPACDQSRSGTKALDHFIMRDRAN